MSQVSKSDTSTSRFQSQGSGSGVTLPIGTGSGQRMGDIPIVTSGSGAPYGSSQEWDDRNRFMSQKPIPPCAGSPEALREEKKDENRLSANTIPYIGRFIGRKSLGSPLNIFQTRDGLFMAAEGGYGPKWVESCPRAIGPYVTMGSDLLVAEESSIRSRAGSSQAAPFVATSPTSTALASDRDTRGLHDDYVHTGYGERERSQAEARRWDEERSRPEFQEKPILGQKRAMTRAEYLAQRSRPSQPLQQQSQQQEQQWTSEKREPTIDFQTGSFTPPVQERKQQRDVGPEHVQSY